MPSFDDITEADRAWAAGFFDGEGCFHLAHGKHATAKVGQRKQDRERYQRERNEQGRSLRSERNALKRAQANEVLAKLRASRQEAS